MRDVERIDQKAYEKPETEMVPVYCQLRLRCHRKRSAYSRGRQRDWLEREVLHAPRLHAGLLQSRRQVTQFLLGLRAQWLC